jgi:nicotinamidase/pyrazinamidase
LATQRQSVLWGVDLQFDFMRPGGELYVPGAEQIVPNVRRLVQTARNNQALLIASACQHSQNDPEFQTFPPHCVRGTAGAELIDEARAITVHSVPNQPDPVLPPGLLANQQIIIEKQVIDVFSNPAAGAIVEEFPRHSDFFVFGVATEYCVQHAAEGLLKRGRRVSLVTDAIAAISPAAGESAITRLTALGARLAIADEALMQIHAGS